MPQAYIRHLQGESEWTGMPRPFQHEQSCQFENAEWGLRICNAVEFGQVVTYP